MLNGSDITFAPAACATSAVLSLEASSTTIISACGTAFAVACTMGPIVLSSLKAGIIMATVSLMRSTKECYPGGSDPFGQHVPGSGPPNIIIIV